MDPTGNRVGLASFMRSGNSYLRKFLEAVTGVTTGGELKRDILLQVAGFMGEGHPADDHVWVTKTHHPCKFRLSDDPEADDPVGNTSIANR